MKLLLVLIVLLLSGCATAPTDGTPAPLIDVSKTKLAVATHNDLLAAAKWATDHGYPARAAVWLAHDAHLTAVEGQISACANAIALALPKPMDLAPVTPFLAIEMAAEAAGNFSGLPASVKINCAAFPIVTLPILPKLP